MNEFNLTKLLEDEGFLDPVRLRRIFLLLTREHFSNPENHINNYLLDYKYTDEPATRSLDVDLDFTYDTEEIGKKPAIFVGTGPFAFKKQVINNSIEDSQDDSAHFFSTQCTTSIKIKHVTTAADLSMLLATQSLNFFGCIREHLMGLIPGVLQYEITQLSPPTLIEATKIRIFQCDLDIALAFDTLWSSYVESHRIKDIIFEPVQKDY